MMVPDVLSISTAVNYWYAFGFMVIVGAILFGLSRSALGLILQATGQDRVEAAGARLQRDQAQARGILRSARCSPASPARC